MKRYFQADWTCWVTPALQVDFSKLNRQVLFAIGPFYFGLMRSL